MRFDGSMIRKQTVKSKLKKTLILLKLLHFKIDFWYGEGGEGAATTLRMYFTLLENNVTILKITNKEIELKIRIISWVCSS